MTTTTKSPKCSICGCTIMVQKRPGLTIKLLRALAIADHVKTLHADRLPKFRRFAHV